MTAHMCCLDTPDCQIDTQPHSQSLTHTLSHTQTQSLTHTHTQTHTHTLSIRYELTKMRNVTNKITSQTFPLCVHQFLIAHPLLSLSSSISYHYPLDLLFFGPQLLYTISLHAISIIHYPEFKHFISVYWGSERVVGSNNLRIKLLKFRPKYHTQYWFSRFEISTVKRIFEFLQNLKRFVWLTIYDKYKLIAFLDS